MERKEEGRAKKEGSKLRIHGRLLSFQLKHNARNNLDSKSGRAGKHTPATTE